MEEISLYLQKDTRSRNGNKVGEFKGGSFKAAIKAKSPIVPVALCCRCIQTI